MPTEDWSPAVDQFGGTAWAPVITGVELVAPNVDSHISTDQVVLVTGRGKPGAVLEFLLDGIAITNATTVDTDGKWSYQLRLSLGQHTLQVRQHQSGQASPWSSIVYILVQPGRVSAWGSSVKGTK